MGISYGWPHETASPGHRKGPQKQGSPLRYEPLAEDFCLEEAREPEFDTSTRGDSECEGAVSSLRSLAPGDWSLFKVGRAPESQN